MLVSVENEECFLAVSGNAVSHHHYGKTAWRIRTQGKAELAYDQATLL